MQGAMLISNVDIKAFDDTELEQIANVRHLASFVK